MPDPGMIEDYEDEYIPTAKAMETRKRIVGFSDLSFWLKVLVVCGWIFVAFELLAFVIGFAVGVMGAL